MEISNFTNDTTTNATTISLTSPTYGFLAIVVCAAGFGTNYIPVKKFNMGDGVFFQWIMCNAILLVGVIVNCIVGCPKMYPFAMIGGALWATGNVLTVTIIEAIGIGLGMIIWSTSNMLFGFFTSRFGWFGIGKRIPKNPILNYVGVAIALVSIFIFASIKPNQPCKNKTKREESDPQTAEGISIELSPDGKTTPDKRRSLCRPISSLSILQRRILGIALGVVSGSLYGNTFVPTLYIQNQYEGASKEGLHYVFSNFVGIWLASTAIFIIYSFGKKNQPWVPQSNAILPAILSGILWGTAQSAWFVANSALGEPITFPIVTTCPALIATVCGVVFFKEITGKRNYILLAVASCITTAGVVLNGLSNV